MLMTIRAILIRLGQLIHLHDLLLLLLRSVKLLHVVFLIGSCFSCQLGDKLLLFFRQVTEDILSEFI